MTVLEAAEICRILSDPHRLEIMRQLGRGEKCASELLRSFTITQPTLSHHKKTMVEGGLLKERRSGKRTYYAIDRGCWDEFLLVLDGVTPETYWETVDLGKKRPRG